MKAFEKLETLPHVASFSENSWRQYGVFKSKSCFLRIPLDFAEFWIRNVWWFFGLIDSKLGIVKSVEVPETFSPTKSRGHSLLYLMTEDTNKKKGGECLKVSVLDDYLCSQLDFFEEQLSKRKGTRYLVTEGGFVHKVWLMICLCLRVGFFLPRMCWKLTLSSIKELRKDVKQTLMLVCRLLGAPVEVRRSTRIRKSRVSSSPLKDKKRKRDDSDGEIEEYFAIDENYCSEEDPDYSIGESSGNCSDEEREIIESENEGLKRNQSKEEAEEEADATKEENETKDEGDDEEKVEKADDIEKEMSEILKEDKSPTKKIEEISSTTN